MPELMDGEFLHNIWAEAGFTSQGDMPSPILWQELEAYARVTATELSAEEWRIVREMSEAYCNELVNRAPLAMSPIDKAAKDD